MTQICCADLLCGWKRYWSLSLEIMYFFATIVFGFLSIKFSWKRAGPPHWYSPPSERIEPSEDIPEGQTLFWRIVFQTSFHEINGWLIHIPFFSENSKNRFVIGLKTEIKPKKDQRRRKREIVRGKTTKIPPSEKLFPSTDEPSLFGNICTMMEMLEPAEDKIGMTQKIHFKTFMQLYIYIFFYLHCK